MSVFANGFLVSDDGVLQVTLSAPSPYYDNTGWASDGTGNRYIEDAGSAVPAGSPTFGGRAYSHTGALYVTDDAPSGEFMSAGLLTRSDGAVYITTDPPDLIIAGLGRTHEGQLCVSTFTPPSEEFLETDDGDFIELDDGQFLEVQA